MGIIFIFGDKAVEQINNSLLPQTIVNQLNGTRKYFEGKGLHIVVDSQAKLEIPQELLKIKIAT